ncbi:hypothetical protein ACIBPB_03800 [Micromonospora sp. NPDC049836]|uniref:hypothetical protein n=1 Tax=Micromonospora sp. NPDC049836 TaxID=3364274 RepID=UPI0037B642F5
MLDQADDLDDAIERLDDAVFWRDEEDDDGSDPDVVVVDLDRGEMCEVDNGHVVRSWLDAFTGTWRRRLA